MMCARFLKRTPKEGHGRLYRLSERWFNELHTAYDRGLRWVLKHQAFTLTVMILTICVNIFLFIIVPKGFFPQQDTGPDWRIDPGFAGHFVRRNACEAAAVHRNRYEGSRGAERHLFHWWRERHEQRPHVYDARSRFRSGKSAPTK